MKNENLFEYFMANWGNLLGGMFIGFSIPIGTNILPFPDFYLFFPLAIICLGVSYYYKFIK